MVVLPTILCPETSMSFQFEIPSKTFVIGEYLALGGTASMVLATEPCFIVRTTRDLSKNFHSHSPGGCLYKSLKQKVGYSLEDPHKGFGGFGRSTAEYLSVFVHDLILKRSVSQPNQISCNPLKEKSGPVKTEPYDRWGIREFILNNLQEFVSTYKEHCIVHQPGALKESQHRTSGLLGYKPSGADLVAQVCGGLCWYDGMNFSCQNLTWPFPGYEIFIFTTGYKQKTHEHLGNLENKNLKILIPALLSARASLEQANLKTFCESLNDYYDILGGLGLSDYKVRTGINHLRKQPEVLAAKGCGAMGVDTVLVVARLSDRSRVEKLGGEQGFSLISCLDQSHSGVRYCSIKESS